jgi:uncharacterized protein YndB with AHSA1/START domain
MNPALAERIAADTVRIERLLPGPVERVWAYLTESEKRAQWLASGEMDLRIGGKVELFWLHKTLSKEPGDPPPKFAAMKDCGHSMTGRMLECNPPHVLAFTWGSEAESSQARFELEERGDEVLLTITHSRLPNREQVLNVSGGWHAHLGILIDRLHGREPGNFWKAWERVRGAYEERYAEK